MIKSLSEIPFSRLFGKTSMRAFMASGNLYALSLFRLDRSSDLADLFAALLVFTQILMVVSAFDSAQLYYRQLSSAISSFQLSSFTYYYFLRLSVVNFIVVSIAYLLGVPYLYSIKTPMLLLSGILVFIAFTLADERQRYLQYFSSERAWYKFLALRFFLFLVSDSIAILFFNSIFTLCLFRLIVILFLISHKPFYLYYLRFLRSVRSILSFRLFIVGLFNSFSQSFSLAVKPTLSTIFTYSDRFFLPLFPTSLFSAFYYFNYLSSLLGLVLDTIFLRYRRSFFASHQSKSLPLAFINISSFVSLTISLLLPTLTFLVLLLHSPVFDLNYISVALLLSASFFTQTTPTFLVEILYRLINSQRLLVVSSLSLSLCGSILVWAISHTPPDASIAFVSSLAYYFVCIFNFLLLYFSVRTLNLNLLPLHS
jgi:hypothetical protein